MKKMLIAGVLLAGSALAVQATDVELPEKGDFAVEISFNPFSENFKTFSLEGAKIKGRYYISDRDAVRVGLGFGYNRNSDDSKTDSDTKTYSVSSDHETNLSFDLGWERHWQTSSRVDLYAGVIGGFEMRNSGSNYEFHQDGSLKNTVTTSGGKSSSDPDYYSVNLGIGTGIDFYIVKGLFIGAELGLTGDYKFYTDYTRKDKVSGGSTTEQKTKNNAKSLNIGLNVQPALRIGWTF